MLEREEGLSEEEKKEAELWFAKEQYKEVGRQDIRVSRNRCVLAFDISGNFAV